MLIHVCMCTHTYTNLYTYICACVHLYTHTFIHVQNILTNTFLKHCNDVYICCRPNGRVQLPLKIPKSNLTFTIGGVAVHPVLGLQIVREPIRVSTD